MVKLTENSRQELNSIRTILAQANNIEIENAPAPPKKRIPKPTPPASVEDDPQCPHCGGGIKPDSLKEGDNPCPHCGETITVEL